MTQISSIDEFVSTLNSTFGAEGVRRYAWDRARRWGYVYYNDLTVQGLERRRHAYAKVDLRTGDVHARKQIVGNLATAMARLLRNVRRDGIERP